MSFAPSWPITPGSGGLVFEDGAFTAALATGLPVGSSPIPVISSPAVVGSAGGTSNSPELVFKQKWFQRRDLWTAQALNTLHPDYSTAGSGWTGPNFFLTAESERTDRGAGMVEWTRTYAAVPATWNSYETFGYTFIGLAGLPVPGISLEVWGRLQKLRITESRIQHDYFLVDPAGSVGSDGVAGHSNIKDPGAIPILWDMQYCGQTYSGSTWYGGALCALNALGVVGTLPSYGSGSTSNFTLSTSSVPAYEAMIHDAQVNGWNATVTKLVLNNSTPWNYIDTTANGSVFGGQLPAERSRQTRWNGNIWERTTRYVLAW